MNQMNEFPVVLLISMLCFKSTIKKNELFSGLMKHGNLIDNVKIISKLILIGNYSLRRHYIWNDLINDSSQFESRSEINIS